MEYGRDAEIKEWLRNNSTKTIEQLYSEFPNVHKLDLDYWYYLLHQDEYQDLLPKGVKPKKKAPSATAVRSAPQVKTEGEVRSTPQVKSAPPADVSAGVQGNSLMTIQDREGSKKFHFNISKYAAIEETVSNDGSVQLRFFDSIANLKNNMPADKIEIKN